MFLINLYAFIKCKIHKIFHTQMQIRILNDWTCKLIWDKKLSYIHYCFTLNSVSLPKFINCHVS